MSTDLDQVAVIIPAYNEQQSLPLVLRDLPAVGLVVVVDNGSTDATADVARSAGATVATEPERGYGSACLAGIQHLRGEWPARHATATPIVVFLDGDYSDDPGLLTQLTDPIADGHADFVLGSRMLGERQRGAMPPQAVWGNRLACWLMRHLWGADYTDLGPFRAIRWDALMACRMSDRNFGWTIEMQIKAKLLQLRTLEIPVTYRKRIGTSKISGTLAGTVRAGTKILATIAKYAVSTRSFATAANPQELAAKSK